MRIKEEALRRKNMGLLHGSAGASSKIQVNDKLAPAQQKTEERLQIHLKQRQGKRASLQKTTERLQQTLKAKQLKRSEKESDRDSRMDDLE